MNPKTMTVSDRLLSNIDIDSQAGCWIWTGAKGRKGYGVLNVNCKQMKAHRQSYLQFVGKIPAGMLVCHKCDNPSCINPQHLFLGTALDNSRDCISKGRQKPIGEDSATAKLTNEDVFQIRAELAKGSQKKMLGKKFGVSARTIFKIAIGQTWKHLDNAEQPAAAALNHGVKAT
ncbi:HNH endonuclease [Petrachloros mirabilis]